MPDATTQIKTSEATYSVRGLAASIAEMLVRHQAEVNAVDCGSIEFHVKPGRLVLHTVKTTRALVLE